ncbi:MAG: hypothetical protein K2N72_09480, partial [Oscillospiraceae bacterium]|nr:hypothetical protein [Oscillospiraceae bacterium]
MKTRSAKYTSVILASCIALTSCAASAEAAERPKADPDKIIYADSYNFEKLSFGNIKEAECSILLEAENAKGVQVSAAHEGFSGTGYADITDNTAFSLSVDIPASQFYKLTVRHRADGHKENPLKFNGMKAMDVYSEAGDWQETTVNGIYLEKGKNEITLGDGWSYFSLDCIKIEKGESLSDSLYENVSGTLCNPYANLKTQNIYQYLKAVYGKRTLAGQCTNYGTNTETDALYLGYGKYPAVRTFDFIYDSINNCKGNPQAKDVDLAIQWSKDGGLVAFDWHWHAPCHEAQFYTDQTSFKLSDAVTETDLAMLSPEEVQKLYDKG